MSKEHSLGYGLPMMEEGEPDAAFEAILDTVDPNRDSHVSLHKYLTIMISCETEKGNREASKGSLM